MPHIIEATLDNCLYVASDLREADKQELQAVRGHSNFREILKDGYRQSALTFCIKSDQGLPIAIYGGGTHPTQPHVGIPWMVSTPELLSIKTWFLRKTPWIVNSVQEHYPILWNLIDVRNTVHINWLQFAGFQFGDIKESFGPENRPFQNFYRFR